MLRAAAAAVCRFKQTQPLARAASVAVRQLSGAAASSKEDDEFAPPIHVYGIPGRYASALFSSAARLGQLDEAQKDICEIYNLTVQSEQFDKFLKDPTIPKKQKAEALDAIAAKLNAAEVTRRFLQLLAQNNRLQEFDKISDTFDELIAAANGEVKATITTAEPLAAEDMASLKSSLGTMLQEGETLLVEEQIDPSIIGGVIIDIADKYIDLSIKTRVKQVQQLIMETI